jgi:hypothetical protein
VKGDFMAIDIKAISQEVQGHHRLFIWAGALLIAFVLGVKLLNHLAHVAELNASVAQKKVDADKDLQKAADDQAARDRTAYAAWKKGSDSRVDALYTQIAALSNQLKAQQDKDRTMPLGDVAARWSMLIGEPASEFNATADGVSVTQPAARKTLVLLDELPADREKIQSQAGVIAERDADLNKKQGLLDDAGAQITACKKTQIDAEASCKKEVAKVKADARKGNVKAFFAGAAALLATIIGLKHGI